MVGLRTISMVSRQEFSGKEAHLALPCSPEFDIWDRGCPGLSGWPWPLVSGVIMLFLWKCAHVGRKRIDSSTKSYLFFPFSCIIILYVSQPCWIASLKTPNYHSVYSLKMSHHSPISMCVWATGTKLIVSKIRKRLLVFMGLPEGVECYRQSLEVSHMMRFTVRM